MASINRKIFTVVCKADYVEGLEVGREYNAKLSVVKMNSKQATLELKVNPDQKTERATPRKEVAKTALWRCTEKEGNLIIQSQRLTHERERERIILQGEQLHDELNTIYSTLLDIQQEEERGFKAAA